MKGTNSRRGIASAQSAHGW